MVDAFRSLHAKGHLLVLANAWDAVSARIVEDLGAEAIATSSAAVAWSCGYPDGGHVPPDVLVAAVERIRRVTSVPLTVDVEDGYSSDPAEVAALVERVVDAGAAGINIEDGKWPRELLEAKISAIKHKLSARGLDVFVNARCDVYLQSLVSPDACFAETAARAECYADAGADGFFAPFVEPADIEALVRSTELPVNVLATASLPSIARLQSLGVRRLSAGGSIARYVYLAAREASHAFLRTGAFPAVHNADSAKVNINALLAP